MKTKFREGQIIESNITNEKFQKGKKYRVVKANESLPYCNQYNRWISYENEIYVKPFDLLDSEEVLYFTTAGCMSGSLSENDFIIVNTNTIHLNLLTVKEKMALALELTKDVVDSCLSAEVIDKSDENKRIASLIKETKELYIKHAESLNRLVSKTN